MFQTPILLLIFNRPELTQKVFERIREIKPLTLYIAADGPRSENEKALCDQTRQVVEKVDWDCEVKTLFRQENLGLKKAVAGALDWFFENEEQGIVLEDDCIACDSFFCFCEEMLEKYKDNDKVMHIGGINFILDKNIKYDTSYYFSNIPASWGWASWRSSWKKFDINMDEYKDFVENKIIQKNFPKLYYQSKWLDLLNNTYLGNYDSWAYIWTYTIFKNNGLTILPKNNLVRNIGFGDDATHTIDDSSKWSNMEVADLKNIVHLEKLHLDKRLEKLVLREYFNGFKGELEFYKTKIKKDFFDFLYKIKIRKRRKNIHLITPINWDEGM